MGTESRMRLRYRHRLKAPTVPIPAPPVTPTVPGPPAPAGAQVWLYAGVARGRLHEADQVLVGVLVVLVIAGVVAIKVANSSRTPEAEIA